MGDMFPWFVLLGGLIIGVAILLYVLDDMCKVDQERIKCME